MQKTVEDVLLEMVGQQAQRPRGHRRRAIRPSSIGRGVHAALGCILGNHRPSHNRPKQQRVLPLAKADSLAKG